MNKRRKLAAIAATVFLVVVAATPASASSGSMNIYGCAFSWSNSSTHAYEAVAYDSDCTSFRVGQNGYLPGSPGVKAWQYTSWRDATIYADAVSYGSGITQSRHYVHTTLAISPYVT